LKLTNAAGGHDRAGMNALLYRSWLWVALTPYALPLVGIAASVFA
jgi:hypothetical protein